MMATRSRRTKEGVLPWVQRFVDAALLAAVALGLLAFGGMRPGVATATAVAVLLLGTIALLLEQPWRRPFVVRWPAVALLVLALWTWVRSWPLFGFLANDWLREACALWPGVEATGSFAPGHAPYYALRLAALAMAVQVGSVRFSSSQPRRALVLTIVGLGALTLLIAFSQYVFGATKILFVYTPPDLDVINPLSSVFTNRNQAATFYGATSMLLLTYAWSQDWQAGGAIGAVLVATCLLLSFALDTRAVFAPLLVTVAVFGGLVLLDRFAPERVSRIAGVALPAALVVTIAGLLYGYGDKGWLEQLLNRPEFFDKTRLWRDALSLSLERPLVGYGPASFPHIVPALTSGQSYYTHVEAPLLEHLVYHGWIVGLGTLGVLAAPILGLVNNRRLSTKRVLFLCSFFLFVSLEGASGMTLNALPYALLVALLLGALVPTASSGRRTTDAPAKWAGPKALAVGFVLMLSVLGVVWAIGASRSLSLHTRAGFSPLFEEVTGSAPDRDAVRAAMLRHAAATPAHPWLIQNVAFFYLGQGNAPAAEPFVAYLERYAPALSGTGHLQAWIGYTQQDATRLCRGLRLRTLLDEGEPSWDEVFRLFRSTPGLVDCVGGEHEGLWNAAMRTLARERQTSLILLASQEMTERYPAFLPGHLSLFQAHVRSGGSELVLEDARTLATRWPDNLDLQLTLLDLEEGAGNTDRVRAQIEEMYNHHHTVPRVVLRYVRLRLDSAAEEELSADSRRDLAHDLRGILDRVQRTRRLRGGEARDFSVLRARAYLLEGDLRHARDTLRRAHERGPRSRELSLLLDEVERALLEQEAEQRLRR